VSHVDSVRAGGAPQWRITALERALILLLSRAARAERACGYDERAVSLFIAAIELSCFAPPALVARGGSLVDDFEAFWEAEAPRIGEAGARGWGHWHAATGGGSSVGGGEQEAGGVSADGTANGDDDEAMGTGGASPSGDDALADAAGWRDPARRAHAQWAASEERLGRSGQVRHRRPEPTVIQRHPRPFAATPLNDARSSP